MEDIKKELENLNLKPLTYKLKTGLTYHKDTLKHRVHEDLEKSTSHPENPKRITEILNYAEQNKELEKIDVLTNFEKIKWEHVEKIHGKEYIEYLQKLFKEDFEGLRYEDGDTYYNKESLNSALLAAEGTRLAAENVIEGKWKNAFALVRPPGHHACAKNNKIGGFCLMNNVAISAKFLLEKYQSKIVIFDWDVHHGDSTQELFYEENNVLYISIHNFMNGNFYPGKSGDLNNVGENKGEGYNLNFPLNPLEDECVGDQEYIYVFERAILPVLKEFNPDFVFISCGFDCLFQDPIGGINVTWDGLGYMLFQIKNIITENIVVALEGGYNLTNLPKAFVSLMRILNNCYFPNESNLKLMKHINYKEGVRPGSRFLKNCDKNLEVWSKYWKSIDNPENFKYEEKIKKVVYEQEKYTHSLFKDYKLVMKKLVKKIGNNEKKFYTKVYPFLDELHKFIPRYYGVLKVKEENFLKIKDFKKIDKCNTLILKLCGETPVSYYSHELFSKYKVVLDSYKIIDRRNNILDRKKGDYCNVSEVEILDILKRFFENFKDRLNKNVIPDLIKQIEALYDVVFQNSLNVSFCSLIINFNRENNKTDVKLLDFEYFELTDDQNCLYSIKMVKELLENFNNTK